MKRAKWLLIAALLAAVVAGGVLPIAFAANRPGNGRVLTRIKFIHYRKGHVKPPWANGGGGKKDDEGYYTYLSKGARWKVLEDFSLNPGNTEGLSEAFVEAAVAGAMAEWEAYGGTIFGALDIDYGAVYDEDVTDDVNSVSFGTIEDPNIIAVANVWGYFTGPPATRELVEADVLFNQAYFDWGDADFDPEIMDLFNIAAHEIGHAAGMGDVYLSGAALETMYGYSDEGETNKRDLYTGDIAGITKLYE